MATLAGIYTSARLEVPGANTTNMPDATLLVFADSLYQFLALLETPRVTFYTGGSFGAKSLSVAGVRIVATVGTDIARILAVRYEGTDGSSTDGRPLDLLTKGQYELERQTFPSANGLPRCVCCERIPGGVWRIYLHPATTAVDIYLSIECEIEPAALTSGSSVVYLTPGNIARMTKLLAARIALSLGRDPGWISGLLSDMADRKLMADWLKREESKSELVTSEARFG